MHIHDAQQGVINLTVTHGGTKKCMIYSKNAYILESHVVSELWRAGESVVCSKDHFMCIIKLCGVNLCAFGDMVALRREVIMNSAFTWNDIVASVVKDARRSFSFGSSGTIPLDCQLWRRVETQTAKEAISLSWWDLARRHHPPTYTTFFNVTIG